MANIKTREKNKGTIKTLDRASIMNQHIKQATPRVKDNSFARSDESNAPENYASDRVAVYGKAVTKKASYKSSELSKSTVRAIKRKKNIIEIKTRKDILLRNRNQNEAIHAPKIKTPSEAQKLNRIKRKAALKDARKKAAAKSEAKTLNTTYRRTAENARKASATLVRSVRHAIEGIKALILTIGAGGTVAIAAILICTLFGAAFYFFGDESSSYTPVSEQVEAYSPIIEKYAKEYGISEYTELIKAVMMQESAGKGTDPMQCSECGLNTKYPNKAGSITDPEYSINVGTHYLANLLEKSGCKSPVDIEHISLALQGYNFGQGYIDWAIKKYGGYSHAGAAEFSKEQAKKAGLSSYGDIDYVDHVLKYYPYGNYSYDVYYNGPGKLGLPIKGMTTEHITSHFGPRTSPGGVGSSDHQGIDIGFPTGTKVLACESGTVISAGLNGGYGKCIVIDHGNNLQTVYAHLSQINVKDGQKVVRGQVIGKVGNTGNSTGPHLHLGVMVNGSYVNPEKGWLSIL